MKKQGNSIPKLQPLGKEHQYRAQLLGDVVTLSEAELLFKKHRSTIERAILKDKLETRKAITGGTILITIRSLIARWGEPDNDIIESLQQK